MKNFKLTIFLFLGVTIQMFAQDFTVPENYKLETRADYEKYKPNVVKAVDWYINTPLNQEKEKRAKVYKFLFDWVQGSPDVIISVNTFNLNAADSPDLLMAFLGGWTKYAIETKKYEDEINGNLAGFDALIQYYETNKSLIGKKKKIEKIMKLKKKGKLKDKIISEM
ncbi:hypothetical protein [Aureivirga sp. CE67]|uniref:hypothetical protein n=1 Tax=Aureivirga sp. CE67 TaxID=1788983 RepID=UPI0018CA1CD8|nr:hypothetical protein [Aureivirga sp. CE67]